jgi:hypothetical protein
MRIPIHSMVDVITNSSTVTYIYAHSKSIQYAKNVLEKIMEILNVDGEVDDYFDIKLILNDRGLDYIWDNMDEENLTEDELQSMIDNNDPALLEYVSEQEYFDISINPKSDVDTNIADMFLNIFTIESRSEY